MSARELAERACSAFDSPHHEHLSFPQSVVQSASDAYVRLYYRFYQDTMVGEKFLCVVVKVGSDDAFVVTAYLTDRVKKGNVLWTA